MKKEDILRMLKIDLGISANVYDKYLINLIELSKTAIQEEGIVLHEENGENTIEDGMLIQMYGAYLYRKRREEIASMPRSLRYALNNRLFSQKGAKGKWMA